MRADRIRLVPPSRDLVAASRDAIKESEKELGEYFTWVQASLDDPENNMEIAIRNYNSFEHELRFYILDNINSKFIGAIGFLIRNNDVPFYELGYWIRTSLSGNGYATEAVTMLEGYTFRNFGANRVEIRTAKENTKSQAVAERCGYLKEAELVNERRSPSGKLTNTIVYAKYCL